MLLEKGQPEMMSYLLQIIMQVFGVFFPEESSRSQQYNSNLCVSGFCEVLCFLISHKILY